MRNLLGNNNKRNGDPKRSAAPQPEPIEDEPHEPIGTYDYGRRSDPPPHSDEDHHEEARLQQLHEMIHRIPLDEVAKLVKALRYEEMIELVDGIRKIDVDKNLPETINLADLLHRWTKFQLGGKNEDK